MNRSEAERHYKLILFSLIISVAVSLCSYYKGIDIIPEGPAVAVHETTKSIIKHGTISSEYFYSIAEDAEDLSAKNNSVVWQDVFTIGIDGDLLPKHSIFSALIALPFYLFLGTSGIWIMQQFFLILLIICIYRLSCLLSRTEVPILLVIFLSLILSPFAFFATFHSYDLHAASLVTAGLYFSYKRPMLGSFLLTLSYFIRPSNLLVGIPLSFCFLPAFPEWKRLIATLTGITISSTLIICFNYKMYGDPLLTAYQRLPEYIDGQIRLSHHPLGFDIQTLFSNWHTKIWSAAGILPFTPCLLALPFTYFKIKQLYLNKSCLIITSTAILYIIYIFSYPMWNLSNYGNRFLLVALAPYLAVLAALINTFFTRSPANPHYS